MTPADFSRAALALEGVEQGTHHGVVDFRVRGKIFATLASAHLGYGNLILSPEQQAGLLADLPGVFLPIAGGWGRLGMTHIVLSQASPAILEGALEMAWRRQLDKKPAKRPQRKP